MKTIVCVLAFTCFGVMAWNGEPKAADIIVNSNADNATANDSKVTLREALTALNSGKKTDLGQTPVAGDRITFDASAFDPSTKAFIERVIFLRSPITSPAKTFTLDGDVNGDRVPDVIINGGNIASFSLRTDGVTWTWKSLIFTNFAKAQALLATLGGNVTLGVTIVDCIFYERAAVNFNYNVVVSIDRSVFYSNANSNSIIGFGPSKGVISNTLIYNNQNNLSLGVGSAIDFSPGVNTQSLKIYNVTVIGNSSPKVVATSQAAGVSTDGKSPASLIDSLIYGNTKSASNIAADINGTFTKANVANGTIPSNVFLYVGDSSSRDLRLMKNSPAINAGGTTTESPNATYDLLGNPRKVGNNYDQGAYEYNDARLLDLDSATPGNNYSTSGAANTEIKVTGNATISKLDGDTNVRYARMSLNNVYDGEAETLILTGSHSQINAVKFNPALSSLELYSKLTATVEDMEAALRNVVYKNTAANPTLGTRSINIILSDASDSNTTTASIMLSAPNTTTTFVPTTTFLPTTTFFPTTTFLPTTTFFPTTTFRPTTTFLPPTSSTLPPGSTSTLITTTTSTSSTLPPTSTTTTIPKPLIQDGFNSSAVKITQRPIRGGTVKILRSNAYVSSAVYDGQQLWLTSSPSASGKVSLLQTFDPETLQATTAYTFSTSSDYSASVYDGKMIWSVSRSGPVVQYDPATKQAQFYNLPSGFALTTPGRASAIYDGQAIWITSGLSGAGVVKLQLTPSVTLTGIKDNSYPSLAYQGAIYDGSHLWLAPNQVNFRKFSLAQQTLSSVASNSTESYTGGTQDGTYLWMIPNLGQSLLRFKISDSQMTSYKPLPQAAQLASQPGFASYITASFDGRFLWLSPDLSLPIVRFDTQDSTFTTLNTKLNGNNPPKIQNAFFDGLHVWMFSYQTPLIARVSPSVNLSYETSDGLYALGKVLKIKANFDAPVIVTGTPQLAFTSHPAEYWGMADSATLSFAYTVTAGENWQALDYLSTTALSVMGGNITYASGSVQGRSVALELEPPGQPNSLSYGRALGVDGLAPTILSVTVSPNNTTLNTGGSFQVQVRFSERLAFTSTPQLWLNTGNGGRALTWTNLASKATTNDTLVFASTVLPTDSSPALDYLATTSLSLSGGGLLTDFVGNPANLSLPPVGTLAAQKLLLNPPQMQGFLPALGATTIFNGNVFSLSFDQAVTAGPGSLKIYDAQNVLKQTILATSLNGLGTTTLSWTVAGLGGGQGYYVQIDANALQSLNGAFFSGIGNNTTWNFTTQPPSSITQVSAETANGTYGRGTRLVLALSLEAPVTVEGRPSLQLNGNLGKALYFGSTGSTLSFAYTVQPGDFSPRLNTKATDSLSLEGGRIYNTFGDAKLTLPNLAATNALGVLKNIVVDGVGPKVANYSSASTAGVYYMGQTLAFTVTFSEAIAVSGTPTIDLAAGQPGRQALATEVNNTSLGFRYTVQRGDLTPALDFTGSSALQGSISDLYGNPSDLLLSLAGTSFTSFGLTLNGLLNTPIGHQPGQMGAALLPLNLGGKIVQVGAGANHTCAILSEGALKCWGANTDSGILTGQLGRGDSLERVGLQNAEMGTTLKAVNLGSAPSALPTVAASAVSFTDSNFTTGNIGGTLAITRPARSENSIDAYAVYWGISTTQKLSNVPLVLLPVLGTDLQFLFANTTLPNNAHYFLVYSRNALGEFATPASARIFDVDENSPRVLGVSSSNADGLYKLGDLLTLQVTFNRPVKVTGTPQLTLAVTAGGRTVQYTSGSGSEVLLFQYTVQAGDSSGRLDYTNVNALGLNGGTIKDAANNTDAALTLPVPGASLSLGANKALVVAARSPSLTLSTPTGSVINGNFPVTFTFSETVTGFDQSDLVLTNVAVASFNGSGASYTANMTPLSNATVIISVPANAAQNLASLGNLASNILTLSYDAIPPTVSLVTTANNSVNAPFNVSFVFSETVNTFASTQVTVSNGSLGSLSLSGTSYIGTLTPTSEGTVTLSVASQSFQDLAGNFNTQASTLSVTYDLTAPTLALSSTASPYINGPVNVSFTFSESVKNFTLNQATVLGANLNDLTWASSALASASMTPTTEGTISLGVAPNQYQDAAGNFNTNAATTLTRVYDTTAPTVSIASTSNSSVNGTFRVTLTFSETIQSLTANLLTLSNGLASDFAGTGASYALQVIPNASPVTLGLAAGSVQDLAGNSNLLATTLSRIYDVAAPTVSLTSSSTSNVNGGFNVTFTFSETVNNFVLSGINVTNGSASNFAGTGTTYTATVTPTSEGTVTISVTSSAAQDLAGNNNTSSSNLNRTYDATSPTLTISSTSNSSLNGSFSLSLSFSETIHSFSASSLSVTNGSVASISSASSGQSYTAIITPTAEGTVSVSMPAGKVQDIAGNYNTASNTLSRTYDATSPTVILSSTAANTVNSAFLVSLTFTENVNGFSSSSLSVTSGTISSTSGSGASYAVTVTPTVEGTVSLSLPANQVTDAAGNYNIASSMLSRGYDATAPTITSGSLVTSNAYIVLDFSEPVFTNSSGSGALVAGDFSLALTSNSGNLTSASIASVANTSGGSLSGGETSIRIVLTLGTSPSGVETLQISPNANQVYDVAGNLMTLANSSGSLLLNDQVAPSVTISSAANTVNNSFTATFTFSETVNNFVVGSITVTNGTASNFSGSGKVYTATITPTTEGSVGVGVASHVAQDSSGNASTLATTLSVSYDTTSPTVALSTTSNSSVNSNFSVALTFSETVTSFSSASLAVTNGTIASTSGSGASYTAVITPTSEGTVEVSVPASRVSDLAGNSNTISNTLSRTYDTTVPTISSASLSSTNAYITLNFSEGVYTSSSASGALTTSDLALALTSNSGNLTSASIASLSKTSGESLSGGETAVRVWLTLGSSPSGVETLSLQANSSEVYDAAGNTMSISSSSGSFTLHDQVAPTLSSNLITISALTSNSLTLTWTKATDSLTAQSALVYHLYRTGTNPAHLGVIDTVAEAQALTTIASTQTDINTYNVTGLTSGNTYAFNVVVADAAGNTSIYSPVGELLSSGLLAYYRFDGNANDASSNALNGTLQSGAVVTGTDRFGVTNSALSLDGTNDYVSITNNFNNHFTSGITLVAWGYPTASGNFARFLDLGNGAATDNILFTRNANTTALDLEIYNGSSNGAGTGALIQSGSAISLNTWQFFAGTISSTSLMGLYKNGVNLKTQAGILPPNANRNNNYIGKSNFGADAYFKGLLDDVRIYSTALTASQIQALYNITTGGAVLAEVSTIGTTSDTTPDYTFSSSKAGTISYGGSCSSSTTTASAGNNTVTFSTLASGTYSTCTIQVTDALSNVSPALTITSFTVQ